ncbi:MAG: DUF1501 domain-containing protein [Ilumatobacteraceae bacterium]
MLDPDISARDALALLSTNDAHRLDGTREGFNRRRFLQMVGLGLGGGAVLSGLDTGVLGQFLPDEWRQAFAGGPLGPTDGVLVIIGMYGGNDGLNTVIPYSNPRYYEYRTNIALRTTGTNPLIPINDDFGLHHNLSFVKALYDQQQVAILHGVGYPNPDLSHFNSMAYWMAGKVGGTPSNGWIGRWLDGIGARADLYTAGTIGSSLPLHLLGQVKRGTAIPENGFGFGGDTDAVQTRFYNGIKSYSSQSAGRGIWHDAIAGASRGQIDLAQRVAPIFEPEITSDSLAKKLTVAARLINADLGFRVLDTSLDSFDHHSGEPYEHGQKMQELNDGIAAFFATLSPTFANRVTLMTFSEFGRTPWSNDSQGTDHGTAGAHFVIGGNVKGGLYGTPPSLSSSTGGQIERWGRIKMTMDFRSMYATMIDGLLGGGASTVLGGNFEKIDLFRPVGAPVGNFPDPGVPGSPSTPTVPATPSGPASFVGMTPARLIDTRDGGAPIGAASSITVQVSGGHGVPADAVAAVLNVTAVDGTDPSYLTVWPADVAKPNTSSLNTRGGDVVPNLVISKLSAAGAVNVFNLAGMTHCVVDVVGYFVGGSGSRFTSLSPSRVLDTRDGIGAPATAVGPGTSIDLVVSGVGGVAADADAVVLNVTVTEPTAAGFITAWPAGAPRPTASNLNFVAGQTVPNLVVAKLGAGGAVSLFNSGGSTHLVADVLGCFRSADGARLIALSPARLLDTREGSGQAVLQTPITLSVVNRDGVPASGVTGVVLNVTATGGSANGYVTVFPSGEARPMASNLNTVAGATRANLVIAKVGADGAVALFNSAGAQHLVVDVVGYFTT